MEIMTCDHIITIEDDESMSNYASSDASLDTEVVSSNKFESAASMRERLQSAGRTFVERSIVKFGKRIGKGGQGSVFEASVSWPFTDRPTKMAVKKFNSNLGISQGQYPLELWTKDCLHVVMPRALFVDDDSSLCMIMPLFSGDLRNVIDAEMRRKRGPPFVEVISWHIIMQLAQGMKGLHSVGVCHRDLKAANILMMSTPMEDKAFAHLVEAGFKFWHVCHIADFESSEDVIGTSFWRAPEVLMSLRTGIPLTNLQWQAADVYSFGMVCYEIVTGEVPFKSERISNYDIVINGGRPELPEYVPELLRKIIIECWHSNPERRPDFGEILGALMRNAQGDPILKVIATGRELSRNVFDFKTESGHAKLMQVKEILFAHAKHFTLNESLGDSHYAYWGLRYVHHVERFIGFIKLLEKEDHADVNDIECQKLIALIKRSFLGFVSSFDAATEPQQYNKDMKDDGPLFLEEKYFIGISAIDIYEELQKVFQMITLDNDNGLTQKEMLEIVDDFVIDRKALLGKDTTMELLDEILVKMDPSGTNDEIAIFGRHVKYLVSRTTFVEKYDTLLRASLGSIIMYFLHTSPSWNHILLQIFGVVLSDSYEIYLGFLCPLLGFLLFNLLVFRFPKYRIYFSTLGWIFSWYISHFLTRSYGFERQYGWIGIWYCLGYGISFSYALILRLHEYLYIKMIRIGASSTYREKKKEE